MRLGTIALFALAGAALSSAAWAGPCAQDIYKSQVAFDTRLDAAAAKGPSAPTTTDAKLHHQLTQKALAQVEAKLGDITPEMASAFHAAIQRARDADKAGDATACKTAIDEANRVLK